MQNCYCCDILYPLFGIVFFFFCCIFGVFAHAWGFFIVAGIYSFIGGCAGRMIIKPFNMIRMRKTENKFRNNLATIYSTTHSIHSLLIKPFPDMMEEVNLIMDFLFPYDSTKLLRQTQDFE